MSLFQVLLPYCLPPEFPPGDDYWTGVHAKPDHYIKKLGLAKWNSFYKFAFVRNPWDRLVSAFFYLSSGGNNAADRDLADRYVRAYKGDFQKFVGDFIARDQHRHLFHLHPQHEFVCDSQGAIQVDYLGKFETIQTDFEQVCAEIEVKPGLLPNRNRTSKPTMHYSEHYNTETKEIVAHKYAKDIALFDYHF